MFSRPSPVPFASSGGFADRPEGSSTPKAADPPSETLKKDQVSGAGDQVSGGGEDSSDSGQVIRIESGVGSRVKLAIPGTSSSVTINFSAEVLDQVQILQHPSQLPLFMIRYIPT
jgi:hypothetical protein